MPKWKYETIFEFQTTPIPTVKCFRNFDLIAAMRRKVLSLIYTNDRTILHGQRKSRKAPIGSVFLKSKWKCQTSALYKFVLMISEWKCETIFELQTTPIRTDNSFWNFDLIAGMRRKVLLLISTYDRTILRGPPPKGGPHFPKCSSSLSLVILE